MTQTDLPNTTIWQRCHIGSCHRHQECMYHPCRAPISEKIEEPSPEIGKIFRTNPPTLDETVQAMSPEQAFEWLLQSLKKYTRNDIDWIDIRDVVHNATLLNESFKSSGLDKKLLNKIQTLTAEYAESYDQGKVHLGAYEACSKIYKLAGHALANKKKRKKRRRVS